MPAKKTDPKRQAAQRSDSDSYDAALKQYASAIKLLSRGDFGAAREIFVTMPDLVSGEPELVERAATYARICDSRMSGPDLDPVTLEERYQRAVLCTNEGQFDEAIQLLNHSLTEDPTSVSCLYVRASAWALQGAAAKAVADLRDAIAIDPKVRFQAVNDPDFEKIREEPSFIDIIEPTPTGA
jgi:tetratricopeptide (TPR) repeat protein